LQDLGLSEHQALLVAHNDTAHIHVMVNRVHPETGKAWDNGHDYARIEKSLRAQERELGLREVSGHHYRLEGQREPDYTAPTTGQLRVVARTGEVSFDERARALAGEDFRSAESWADLAQRLDRHGLHVEKRGRGLVVTDGQNVAKCSSIGRTASLAALEKRFGRSTGKRLRRRAACCRSPAETRRPGRPRRRGLGGTAPARSDADVPAV
jgi:hypothetical protein